MTKLSRVALGFLLILGAVAYNQPRALATCQGVNTPLQTMGYESITVSTVSIGFTAGAVSPTGLPPAIYAYVTTETNSIRFRADGIAPTSSEGHLVSAPGAFEVCGQQAVNNLRMIRSSADATVKATYYRAQQ